MTICVKCKQDIDEDGDCRGCKNLKALFIAWKDITESGWSEIKDFDDEIYSKHPILTDSDYHSTIKKLHFLEWKINSLFHNTLKNRMRHYHLKRGKGTPWITSTQIWKKNTTGKRKAPLISATCFDIGDKLKGCTGIMHIVKRKKDGTQFWTTYHGD